MVVERRRMHPIHKVLAIVCGVLFVISFILTLVEMGVIEFGDEIKSYISIQADKANPTIPDRRGVFARVGGTFYEMLGFDIPAPELLQRTLHVPQDQMQGVFVERPTPEEQASFLLYRVSPDQLETAIQGNATGDDQAWIKLGSKAQTVPVTVERIGTTTTVRMRPADNTWEPGGYMLRLPAEGTSIGIFWFYFVVE